ncbi:MAG: hypothetical protein FJX11_05680 [Alphaproteobacteria bacterium]|nr:hypothetical protein [Alphaproteobacteria bacterium]
MTRTYRRIVDQYRRDYPHQIRLEHAGGWRARYITHAFRQLGLVAVRDRAEWFESGVLVFGFRSREHSNAFYAWTLASCIDWQVPPNEQDQRPAPVPEHFDWQGPTPHRGFKPR